MYKSILVGVKPVNDNTGSGSTLARKARTKYSKRLNNSNGNFSLNSSINQTYIGNPNSNLSYVGCKEYDTTLKSSVKSYSGYLLKTRIVNGEIKKNINNSLDCYKTNNVELEQRYNNGNPLNKHFSNSYNNNKDADTRIKILKSRCRITRDNYINELENNSSKNDCSTISNNNINKNIASINSINCNITKDMYVINKGYTPGYDIYYTNPTLFHKKKCNYNPPDAKIIAC